MEVGLRPLLLPFRTIAQLHLLTTRLIVITVCCSTDRWSRTSPRSYCTLLSELRLREPHARASEMSQSPCRFITGYQHQIWQDIRDTRGSVSAQAIKICHAPSILHTSSSTTGIPATLILATKGFRSSPSLSSGPSPPCGPYTSTHTQWRSITPSSTLLRHVLALVGRPLLAYHNDLNNGRSWARNIS